MTVIPENLWPEIAAGAANSDGTPLPDAARPEVEALVRSYKGQEWAPYERVSRPTKELLKEVLLLGAKFRDQLAELERNREYQCFNTGGHPVCIEPLSEMQNSID